MLVIEHPTLQAVARVNTVPFDYKKTTNAQSAGLRSWEMQQRAMQQREMQLRGMHHCLSKQH